MRFTDWVLSISIIVIMFGLYLLSIVFFNLAEYKKNWIEHRCTPTGMAMAGFINKDPVDNFNRCIAQKQKVAMPYHLEDLNVTTAITNGNIKNLGNSMSALRKLQSKMRPAFGSNILNVYGIFNNIIIIFQKFIITFRDILSRIIAIVTLMLYVMQGQFLVGESIVKGPIVGALKVLSFGAIH